MNKVATYMIFITIARFRKSDLGLLKVVISYQETNNYKANQIVWHISQHFHDSLRKKPVSYPFEFMLK